VRLLDFMKSRVSAAAVWFLAFGLSFLNGAAPAPRKESAAEPASGHSPLSLGAATRARIQLVTQPLVLTNLPAETRAYGHVLDPAPLALLDAELDGAEAALLIARAQEAREQALFEREQIVARADLEAAQLQVRAAETRFETALRRLATEWGDPFLQLAATNRHVLVRRLLRRELILLRVELPAGESLPAAPTKARIGTLGAERDRTASFFSEAPTVEVKTLGRAFLLQADGPDDGLRPGGTLTAYFAAPDSAIAGALVPAAAVVRHLGHPWIYVSGEGDAFERLAITLDRQVGRAWFTTSILPPNATVVVQGAQLLLSEELKSQLVGD
jgi:hypothetical protein